MTHLSHYTILPASLRDLNSLRRLERECFAQDAWPLWDIIAVLALPRVVRLKASLNGDMVAFAAADPHPAEGIGWIITMGVMEAHRGQGIGGTLLAACEERLKLPRVRLCVRVNNDPAIRLYKKAGYHTIDIWHGYYARGEDALVMEKII